MSPHGARSTTRSCKTSTATTGNVVRIQLATASGSRLDRLSKHLIRLLLLRLLLLLTKLVLGEGVATRQARLSNTQRRRVLLQAVLLLVARREPRRLRAL